MLANFYSQTGRLGKVLFNKINFSSTNEFNMESSESIFSEVKCGVKP